MSFLLRKERVVLLIGWHAAVAMGALLAPHPVSRQYRDYPYAPPSRIHVVHEGRLTWPFVYALRPHQTEYGVYVEDTESRYPLRLLVRRADGELALIGLDAPGLLFPLGTDEFGRDVFSRLLAGGLLSVGCGLAATAVALLLAALLGGLAGYAGGVADMLLNRAAELLMAVPALYLLLAVRAGLPIHTDPAWGFLLAMLLIAMLGWARPARLVRGVVLSVRERGHVLAARGFGAGHWHLLRRHLLPETRSLIAVQAALLVPQFVLLEVTLSFFGLGVPEPTASWGTMLSSLRQYPVLSAHWWMISPGVALMISLLLFGAVTRSLEQSRNLEGN